MRASFRIISAATAATFLWTQTVFGIPQTQASAGNSAIPPGASGDALSGSAPIARLADWHVPEILGSVQDRWEGKAGKFVFHIQDTHANYESQLNTAQILAMLCKDKASGQLGFIGVEGAAGRIDVSQLRRYAAADPNLSKQIADYFVHEAWLSGAGYFSIFQPGNLWVQGMEDLDLYVADLESFLQSHESQKIIAPALNGLKDAFQKVSETVYGPKILPFIHFLQSYKKGDIGFSRYCELLAEFAAKAGVDLSSYPVFQRITGSIRLEKSVQTDKVEKERAGLIAWLEKKMGQEDLKHLVTKSLLYRTGKISSLDFYDYLQSVADKHRVNWAGFKSLQGYAQMVRLQSGMQIKELFAQCEQIEDAIKAKGWENAKEKDLDAVTKRLSVLDNLVHLRMSRSDWAFYQQHKDSVSGKALANYLGKLLSESGVQTADGWRVQAAQGSVLIPKTILVAAPDIDSHLAIMQDFYQKALLRDQALVKNTLRWMDQTKSNAAVLITGGFHTEGTMELLKQKGISYVVVSPRLTKTDQESIYLARMLNEDLPLENFFTRTGSRIAIADVLSDVPVRYQFGNRIFDSASEGRMLKQSFHALFIAAKARQILEEKGSMTPVALRAAVNGLAAESGMPVVVSVKGPQDGMLQVLFGLNETTEGRVTRREFVVAVPLAALKEIRGLQDTKARIEKLGILGDVPYEIVPVSQSLFAQATAPVVLTLEQQIDQGMRLLLQEKLDEALEIFTRLLEEHPENSKVQQGFVAVLHEKAQHEVREMGLTSMVDYYVEQLQRSVDGFMREPSAQTLEVLRSDLMRGKVSAIQHVALGASSGTAPLAVAVQEAIVVSQILERERQRESASPATRTVLERLIVERNRTALVEYYAKTFGIDPASFATEFDLGLAHVMEGNAPAAKMGFLGVEYLARNVSADKAGQAKTYDQLEEELMRRYAMTAEETLRLYLHVHPNAFWRDRALKFQEILYRFGNVDPAMARRMALALFESMPDLAAALADNLIVQEGNVVFADNAEHFATKAGVYETVDGKDARDSLPKIPQKLLEAVMGDKTEIMRHSMSVTLLAAALARFLGLQDMQEYTLTQVSGQLHDLGKAFAAIFEVINLPRDLKYDERIFIGLHDEGSDFVLEGILTIDPSNKDQDAKISPADSEIFRSKLRVLLVARAKQYFKENFKVDFDLGPFVASAPVDTAEELEGATDADQKWARVGSRWTKWAQESGVLDKLKAGGLPEKDIPRVMPWVRAWVRLLRMEVGMGPEEDMAQRIAQMTYGDVAAIQALPKEVSLTVRGHHGKGAAEYMKNSKARLIIALLEIADPFHALVDARPYILAMGGKDMSFIARNFGDPKTGIVAKQLAEKEGWKESEILPALQALQADPRVIENPALQSLMDQLLQAGPARWDSEDEILSVHLLVTLKSLVKELAKQKPDQAQEFATLLFASDWNKPAEIWFSVMSAERDWQDSLELEAQQKNQPFVRPVSRFRFEVENIIALRKLMGMMSSPDEILRRFQPVTGPYGIVLALEMVERSLKAHQALSMDQRLAVSEISTVSQARAQALSQSPELAAGYQAKADLSRAILNSNLRPEQKNQLLLELLPRAPDAIPTALLSLVSANANRAPPVVVINVDAFLDLTPSEETALRSGAPVLLIGRPEEIRFKSGRITAMGSGPVYGYYPDSKKVLNVFYAEKILPVAQRALRGEWISDEEYQILRSALEPAEEAQQRGYDLTLLGDAVLKSQMLRSDLEVAMSSFSRIDLLRKSKDMRDVAQADGEFSALLQDLARKDENFLKVLRNRLNDSQALAVFAGLLTRAPENSYYLEELARTADKTGLWPAAERSPPDANRLANAIGLILGGSPTDVEAFAEYLSFAVPELGDASWLQFPVLVKILAQSRNRLEGRLIRASTVDTNALVAAQAAGKKTGEDLKIQTVSETVHDLTRPSRIYYEREIMIRLVLETLIREEPRLSAIVISGSAAEAGTGYKLDSEMFSASDYDVNIILDDSNLKPQGRAQLLRRVKGRVTKLAEDLGVGPMFAPHVWGENALIPFDKRNLMFSDELALETFDSLGTALSLRYALNTATKMYWQRSGFALPEIEVDDPSEGGEHILHQLAAFHKVQERSRQYRRSSFERLQNLAKYVLRSVEGRIASDAKALEALMAENPADYPKDYEQMIVAVARKLPNIFSQDELDYLQVLANIKKGSDESKLPQGWESRFSDEELESFMLRMLQGAVKTTPLGETSHPANRLVIFERVMSLVQWYDAKPSSDKYRDAWLTAVYGLLGNNFFQAMEMARTPGAISATKAATDPLDYIFASPQWPMLTLGNMTVVARSSDGKPSAYDPKALDRLAQKLGLADWDGKMPSLAAPLVEHFNAAYFYGDMDMANAYFRLALLMDPKASGFKVPIAVPVHGNWLAVAQRNASASKAIQHEIGNKLSTLSHALQVLADSKPGYLASDPVSIAQRATQAIIELSGQLDNMPVSQSESQDAFAAQNLLASHFWGEIVAHIETLKSLQDALRGEVDLLANDVKRKQTRMYLERGLRVAIGRRIIYGALLKGEMPPTSPQARRLSDQVENARQVFVPSVQGWDKVNSKVQRTGEVQAYADPDLLDTVLDNLIKNAIEAMKKARERTGAQKSEMTFVIGEADGMAELRVQDSGTGIDPLEMLRAAMKKRAELNREGIQELDGLLAELRTLGLDPQDADLERSKIPAPLQKKMIRLVFLQNVSTKGEEGGKGVGLDLVKAFAQHMQGTIDVESRPGSTTFILRLPMKPAVVIPPEQILPPPAKERLPAQRRWLRDGVLSLISMGTIWSFVKSLIPPVAFLALWPTAAMGSTEGRGMLDKALTAAGVWVIAGLAVGVYRAIREHVISSRTAGRILMVGALFLLVIPSPAVGAASSILWAPGFIQALGIAVAIGTPFTQRAWNTAGRVSDPVWEEEVADLLIEGQAGPGRIGRLDLLLAGNDRETAKSFDAKLVAQSMANLKNLGRLDRLQDLEPREFYKMLRDYLTRPEDQIPPAIFYIQAETLYERWLRNGRGVMDADAVAAIAIMKNKFLPALRRWSVDSEGLRHFGSLQRYRPETPGSSVLVRADYLYPTLMELERTAPRMPMAAAPARPAAYGPFLSRVTWGNVGISAVALVAIAVGLALVLPAIASAMPTMGLGLSMALGMGSLMIVEREQLDPGEIVTRDILEDAPRTVLTKQLKALDPRLFSGISQEGLQGFDTKILPELLERHPEAMLRWVLDHNANFDLSGWDAQARDLAQQYRARVAPSTDLVLPGLIKRAEKSQKVLHLEHFVRIERDAAGKIVKKDLLDPAGLYAQLWKSDGAYLVAGNMTRDEFDRIRAELEAKFGALAAQALLFERVENPAGAKRFRDIVVTTIMAEKKVRERDILIFATPKTYVDIWMQDAGDILVMLFDPLRNQMVLTGRQIDALRLAGVNTLEITLDGNTFLIVPETRSSVEQRMIGHEAVELAA